jgi:hypothetical protein
VVSTTTEAFRAIAADYAEHSTAARRLDHFEATRVRRCWRPRILT